MKVLLVSANTETINMPTVPAGLGAVATALTHGGHGVEFLDLMVAGDPLAAVREAREKTDPAVIGISIRNIDDQSYVKPAFLLDKVKDVVSACREGTDAMIVLGGAGYSIFPVPALEYLGADAGIRGEGEAAMVELVDLVEGGQNLSGVPGLCLAGKGAPNPPRPVSDLDALPLPEPRLFSYYLPTAEKIWMPFQTRRGCPMDCSYCSTCAIEGSIIRKRSPEKAVAALADYAGLGFKKFFFTDNTFNLPPSYARALCREMIERGLDIQWRCIVYPKNIDDSLARDMAAAGCREASIGFESGSENVLHVMNKRFGPGEVRDIAARLGDAGIRRMGFLLLGGPGETRETAMESLEFADSLGLDAMRVTAGIRIYPDTALARDAVKEGIISPDDDLLLPRHYLVPGLEEWLLETVKEWASTRPNWIV